MRRTVVLLLISLMGAVSLPAEQPVLKYSTNPYYPPYDWGVGDTGFDGASIELLSLVLPPSIRVEAVPVPWKRALSMAAAGEIDLLLSLRITPERSAYLDFAAHRAFPNPIAVFVRRGSPISVKDWANLAPFTGGVSLGDTFGGGFDEYLRDHLSVESAPTMIENFRKLRAGRIDYFVSGYYMGQSYLAAAGLDAEIVALHPFVSNLDIHFAFSKKSPWTKLLPQVSAALAELDRKGALESILQKHLERFSAKGSLERFKN